jgi:integrase
MVDFADATGRRDRRQFATKREADAFRIEVEGQIKGGTFRPDASKIAISEVAEQYLAYCQGRLERGERMTRHNLAVYRGHVANHILHPAHGIGGLKLAQLTAATVDALRDRLRSAGVSVVTTRKIIGTLRTMLSFAIRRDLVAINAAIGTKVIGRRDEGAKKIVPPTKDAMRRIIEAADHDFRMRVIVAAATGLRAGEFHALRWKHLDLRKGEVTVETRVDAYRSEDVTKTSAGMRTVPIAAAVVAVLTEWKLRSPYSRPGDLVFPNRRGGYESHDNMVKRHFKPTCARAAVDGVNWHALRHFAISTWIEQGLSPKTVQTFAGHSSLQVTMDRYGHLFPSDDHKQAMDRIASALFE